MEYGSKWVVCIDGILSFIQGGRRKNEKIKCRGRDESGIMVIMLMVICLMTC